MRTMMLRGALSLAILLACGVAPALAQSLVRGVVRDEKKQPVDGATVLFELKDSKRSSTTKTNRRGEFTIVGLQSGEYTVTASKDGVGKDIATGFAVSQTKINIDFTLQSAYLDAPAGAAAPTAGKPLTVEDRVGASAAAAVDPKAKEEAAALRATAVSAVQAMQAGNHQEAVTKFQEVVGKSPTCGDCYLYLATSHYALKQFDEAEAAAKKSVEIQPTVEGYTALTRLYNDQKKFDLAAEMSRKASELGGGGGAPGAGGAAGGGGASTEALYNEGVTLWNAGKFAEAKPKFEAAVKADRNNADAQYWLGMASINGGDLKGARSAFEAYLEVAPNGSRAAEVKTFLSQLPK
jgi:outer membrane protein assembly factor BamD (BamD/ComL family)